MEENGFLTILKMMGELLELIVDEFVCAFKVGSRNNLEIKKEINVGFSGAEVYLIELTNDSAYIGKYFLKIDTSDVEYNKIEKGYCFSNVVKVIGQKVIKDYYVILMQIAGQSSIEFSSYYDIDSLLERKNAICKIIPDILEQSTKKREYIRKEIGAATLFKKYLGTKLEKGNALEQYVSSAVKGKKANEVTDFSLERDMILPNAYAYAVNESLLGNVFLRDTVCAIHGDLHGNNLFYSPQKKEYALIDLASYREDGYLFYDVAYFELSLLLHNSEKYGLMDWSNTISEIASKNWAELNCLDKELYQAISQSEDSWIEKQTNNIHSNKDSLLEARYVARILAGLNYAGKAKVSAEIRRKSFIFACIYLKYLFEIKKIYNREHNFADWQEVEGSVLEDNDIEKLLDDVDSFSDTKKYILVLGNQCEYTESIYDALARVHWSGIITFSREEKIEKSFNKYTTVNNITVKNGLDLITRENLWCIYADGVYYYPETMEDTFPKWRNKYYGFWSKIAEKIETSISPDEIDIIVDVNSFSETYFERLDKLLENIDLIENTVVNLYLLCKCTKYKSNENKYANFYCQKYQTNIESIAEYCIKYLGGISEEEITLPTIQNIRKKIPITDYKYIKNYVSLLHNRVLQEEGIIDEIKKKEFYFGQEILWKAIDEHLYVSREEYIKYENEILNKIEKEHNQFAIKIHHKPGAGASVMFKVLGWKLRDRFPVVLVNKMNENIIECIQRLYSLSGLHIILFLDGDFTDNEFNHLFQQSKIKGIKVGIVFSYRYYDDAQKDILSNLSNKDGLKFMEIYSKKMKELKDYTDDILAQRTENMRKLATENALVNYRLPFFFGVNAFEEDYLNIRDYLDGIIKHISKNNKLKKVVNYIALITYYTEETGLPVSYTRKILEIGNKVKIKEMLKQINGELSNFVYYANGCLKICHSVVAIDILRFQYYQMDSLQFEELLEDFVNDLYECESTEYISESLNNLLMNLFIKRDIEGDITDNYKRKNFSPLIMALNNTHLQEQFFAFLIGKIPNNAHFRQHYGRLIIYNSPTKLLEAKEQFDKAIELDPLNPLHYHARGNMYTKYVISLCNNIGKDSTEQQLFDKIAIVTQEAIDDFETSIDLINKYPEISMDLSYPYASLVQTITYVVHQLYLKNSTECDEKEFLTFHTNVSKWCKQLINKAETYDIDTEQRYDVIRENEFYKNVRRYLVKYRFSIDEIQHEMTKRPNDLGLICDFLYSVGRRNSKWDVQNQEELRSIIECCKKIINESNIYSEGIIWRWFNASINYKRVKINEMLALLETLDKDEKMLSVQFMLYVIKLSIYIKDLNDAVLSETIHHIHICSRLSKDSNRNNTRYYYNKSGIIGLCYEKEKGADFEGTVIECEGPQSGYISLKINPKLKAFFVPSIIGMRKEGAVGTSVKFKLGVSYSGLRAWDVQVICGNTET